MKPIPDDLYRKIIKVSDEVKANLRKKGIVIPVENDDGSISLGTYKIKKNSNFYSIVDYSGEIVIDKINLPQTAAMLANSLALGRYIDDILVNKDRQYGYALFEETLHKQAAQRNKKKDIDHMGLMLTKCATSRQKKERFKREILNSFEKLRKLA